ncbi:Bacterial regulatory protein, Fis family [compost metagenome]
MKAKAAGILSVAQGKPGADDLSLGFHGATAHYQKHLIEAALAVAGGNLQRAATTLKISRHAMRHQMIKLGMIAD